jgi:arylsulfatase A-like enzyme
MGQWKLHEYFEDGAVELYDLSQDRGERHDLAQALPEKTADLRRILNDWRLRIGAPVPSKLNPKYDSHAEAEALAGFQ